MSERSDAEVSVSSRGTAISSAAGLSVMPCVSIVPVVAGQPAEMFVATTVSAGFGVIDVMLDQDPLVLTVLLLGPAIVSVCGSPAASRPTKVKSTALKLAALVSVARRGGFSEAAAPVSVMAVYVAGQPTFTVPASVASGVIEVTELHSSAVVTVVLLGPTNAATVCGSPFSSVPTISKFTSDRSSVDWKVRRRAGLN